MAAFLTVDDVTQVFPLDDGGRYVALKDIDLEIHKGEFIALIGHSGCGKSTLLNLIAGLTQASSGGILIDSRQVTEPGPDRMVVFQNYSLLPWQTAHQNVALAVNRVMAGSSPAERRAIVERSLALVGLTQAADKFPSELSGGMKQRVAIARALSIRPRLLLLDEPFGALDALTRGNLQQQLMQICQETGVTTVMVTHDVDEALLLADRVVMMTNGPEAGIGQILRVPFERPRQRLEVMEHPDYYNLRSELISFLQQQRRLRQRRATTAASALPLQSQRRTTACTLRLGYLPGLDIAPLAVAIDQQLLDTESVQLVPVSFASWERLESALVAGELQAAITAATTPLALNLGLGGRDPWAAITSMTVSRNGNALCLARPLLEQGVIDRGSLRRWLEQRSQPLRLAVPQRHGIAELLVRHWLAGGGIDTERLVNFEALSPMTMQGALRTEQVDGFVAGRFRVAAAVEDRQAYVLATDLDIWSGHPEKVLTCSESFAASEPEALAALGAALMRAGERCDDGGRREELAQLLSQPQWLGSRAAVALRNQFDDGSGDQPPTLLPFNRFHADRAHVPNPAEGSWLLSQFSRWGLCPFPNNRQELLGQVYRTDLCEQAQTLAGYPSLRPDRHPFLLADGIAFDQDDPLAYLRCLPDAAQPPQASVAMPPVAGAPAIATPPADPTATAPTDTVKP
jgi:nitrate/nitrite transport system ATP-binding protein